MSQSCELYSFEKQITTKLSFFTYFFLKNHVSYHRQVVLKQQ